MQDILKYVDVFVGLSLVMLLASTAVSAITQLFTSGTFARARFLRRGVSKLIAQLAPELSRKLGDAPRSPMIADVLADSVLRHPMIGHEGSFLTKAASGMIMGAINKQVERIIPGGVIDREELIRVLLEIAADEGPLSGDQVPAEIREVLRKALASNGVTDAPKTLKDIREKRIELELLQPQLSQAVWQAQAVMTATACDLVGKVNSWFDNTMDRVTQRFALMARTVTAVVALIFVVSIQLDIRDLISRLWADDTLRSELVAEATDYQTRVDSAKTRAGAPDVGTDERSRAQSEAAEDQERFNAVQQSLQEMRKPGLQLIPDHLVWEGVARAQFTAAGIGPVKPPVRLTVDGLEYPLALPATVASVDGPQLQGLITRLRAPLRIANAKPDSLELIATNQNINSIRLEHQPSAGVWVPISTELPRRFDWGVVWSHFWGVVFAWILVSLGAPFWYDALKNLLKFRSLVAQKEDKHREERNTSQAPPTPVSPKEDALKAAGGK